MRSDIVNLESILKSASLKPAFSKNDGPIFPIHVMDNVTAEKLL